MSLIHPAGAADPTWVESGPAKSGTSFAGAQATTARGSGLGRVGKPRRATGARPPSSPGLPGRNRTRQQREGAAMYALLKGVRVLDVSLLAPSMLGMRLAERGADVIKIDHPPNGDRGRIQGPPYRKIEGT